MNYWILWINPAEFRLMDWLQDYNWVSDDSLIDFWDVDCPGDKAQPGDIVYIMNGGDQDYAAGICGRAKIIAEPDIFPLAHRKKEYSIKKEEVEESDGMFRIALKYMRLCLGAPLSVDEPDFSAIENGLSGLFRISNEKGIAIERMLKGRTSTIGLPDCRT